MNVTENTPHPFRAKLIALINKGVLSRSDLVLFLLFPWFVHARVASKVLQLYYSFIAIPHIPRDKQERVEIGIYDGDNPAVIKMMKYLQRNLADDLKGAYVHGSLGTYEEEAYSDFDALVVLKDEVFTSRKRLMRVSKRLRMGLQIMYDYDPLQHHGWFVLTERDLDDYNESYFPVILLEYSKSLLKDEGRDLRISIRKSGNESETAFQQVAGSILSRLDKKQFPVNLYQLKSMLSEFMLLPALYLYARSRVGVFKKDSFPAVEKELGAEYWGIMEQVSLIRKEWKYEITAYERWMMTRVHPARKYIASIFAPKIPPYIEEKLSEKFYFEMGCLIQKMRDSLYERVSEGRTIPESSKT